MKHLKRFDEELSPETYRKAGRKLQHKFKEERGAKLIDYGNKQDHGMYLMHYAFGDALVISSATFTDPRAQFIFQPRWHNRYEQGRLANEIKDAEELVRGWKQGIVNLGFQICFNFMASEETKQRSTNSALRDWKGTPMFSLDFELHSWGDGLDEWNSEAVPGEEHDVYEMFQADFHPQATLNRPNSEMGYGIFADRQSALLFKRNLPKLADKFDEQIQEIISVIGGESEHIEKIKDLFGKISINGLYEDAMGTKHTQGVRLHSRWFNGNRLA